MRLLTTSWIVPVSAPPIRDGVVGVEDGRIAWVGTRDEAPGPVEDLGPGVLTPGFVNAHCHLELTHLAGLSCEGGFVAWVERLVAARAEQGPAPSREGARRGIRTLVDDTATVAVGDISNALLHLDELEASGLQAVVFYEQLAWDPARAEPVIVDAITRLGALPPYRHVDVRLAAHAPYSVSPELFSLLRVHGGPAFLHLAESPAETEFLRDGTGPWAEFLAKRVGPVPFTPPGLSPVRYADSLGVLRDELVAAHCVQVPPEDAAVLAERRVHAVLCPSSNCNLDVGRPDLPTLLAAGVKLALGTDSVASGDTLDVRNEAVLLREAFPQVPADAIVRALTRGGAEALGLRDLGAIAAGKRAAFAFLPAGSAPADPHAHVLAREARAERLVA